MQGIPDDPNDPVLVDMSVALPGAGRTEDVGAFLITNQFAQLATPPVLSYKPATPPSDGRVTVIHINDQGIVCCQAVNSGKLIPTIMLNYWTHNSCSCNTQEGDGSFTNGC